MLVIGKLLKDCIIVCPFFAIYVTLYRSPTFISTLLFNYCHGVRSLSQHGQKRKLTWNDIWSS